jgi:putative heme iron utilization protein
MDASQAHALRSLLEGQRVAALATLHRDEPAVSMVPYVLLPEARGFAIHVSRLATHTADMLANPAVGLLVTPPVAASGSVLDLPRASVRGTASPCGGDDPGHAQAKALYVARFPESDAMFAFADFSLFVVAVRSVRFVGGFAQARTVSAEQYASLMGAGA